MVHIIKHLASGGCGAAYLAEDEKRGKIVVKKIKLPQLGQEVSTEGDILLSLLGSYKKAHNIIDVFKQELFSGETRLHMEYCEGGDLTHLLRKVWEGNAYMCKAFVRHVEIHIAAGLLYLHKGVRYSHKTGSFFSEVSAGKKWNAISHRDIKPDNIFFRMTRRADKSSRFPDIVLGDFGMAVTKYKYKSYWPHIRAEPERWSGFTDQRFAPPEYFSQGWYKGLKDTKKDSLLPSYDIWQFGAVLYKMITNRYLESNATAAMHKQWGDIINDVDSMTRDDPDKRMRDSQFVEKIPFWKRRRDYYLEDSTFADRYF
jgi:serine/threonine protein kinase